MSLGKGIPNLGNTCYINSILQCLRYSKHLVYRLKKHNTSVDSDLISSFIELLFADAPVENLYTFVKELGKTNEFTPLKQCDAHELFLYLIDKLFTELKEYKNPFEGKLLSTVTCSICGNKSVTSYPFTSLSLPIPQLIKNVYLTYSIEELIEEYCMEEVLDTPIECDKCKVKTESCKHLEIDPSDIVVVHLKRFLGNNKLVNPIEIRSHINIGLHGYSLYACCNHSGTMFSGHYTAACMKRDGTWSLCNDKKVNTLASLPKESDRPYILFYCKT